jgi:hypothetical protein
MNKGLLSKYRSEERGSKDVASKGVDEAKGGEGVLPEV